MFDSLLNSKFYNKCKHAFKCIRTRLVPIQRKKQAMIRFLKKDVADLLANGLDTHAFGRMDGLIIEMNHASCYDMIEHFCEYIGKQLSGLQKQRDCPQEAREAVSTLIFAAARFPDLPELCDLRHIFTERYGNFLEPFVSLEFVQKLDNKLFINEEKLQAMQSIAEEFSVGFDTKALEIKLWTAPETKHDLLEKDSVKQVELAVPMSYKQEDEDAPCERKSEATPVGHKQKLEAQLKPKYVQAVANGIGRLNEDTRRQHSDKSDDKEHLEKSVSPLDMKGSNTQKGVQKANKKYARPCEKELMEAVELDLNGLPKQGFGSVKFPETDSNKIVPPNAKPKEAKKEHDVEKENDKCLGYHHRSCMPGGPDHSRRHADSGLKTRGQENQGLSSMNPSNGNTTNRVPPYAKLNGAKGKNCAAREENNGLLHDRPQHLADLGHPVQDGQRVPERVANMRPPYVKPKFNMQPVNDDPAKQTASDYSKHNITEQQTDHLADKDVLCPVSVRRKKPPAPVDVYDEAPNNEKITSRTPSSHRRHSIMLKGANENYDWKGNGIDVVGNGKNVQRTPSSRPRHSGRRNGALYNDDYDGFMQRHQADEDETAIEFGNLLPRNANGQWRFKSENANVQNGDQDEEERMMDNLLMHYSKKGLDMDEAKTRTETNKTANGNGVQIQCQQNGSMHPPGRAISLPQESVNPDEDVKVPARSTSLPPDCPRSVLVHPRMPDFDELAARVVALRKA